MSHAILLVVLDTGAVWSIARGLERTEATYKSHLAECDLPHRNDLDGRGNLSEEALASFTRYFLETCIDQVTFMEGLMQPDKLRARILLWAEEEAHMNLLPPKAGAILEAVLYRGELPRGDVADILGQTPQRRVATSLHPVKLARIYRPCILEGLRKKLIVIQVAPKARDMPSPKGQQAISGAVTASRHASGK